MIERSRGLLSLPSDFKVVGEALQYEKSSASEALEGVKALKPLTEDPFISDDSEKTKL